MKSKQKKFYNKWWFWLIVGLVILAIIGSSLPESEDEVEETIEPQLFEPISETEYLTKIETASKELVPTVEEAITVVDDFNNEIISIEEYFNKMYALSMFQDNDEFLKIYDDLDFIPPEKYEDYFIIGISALDNVFLMYDEDSELNEGFFAQNYLDDAIAEFDKSHEETEIQEILTLKNKLTTLREKIPLKP